MSSDPAVKYDFIEKMSLYTIIWKDKNVSIIVSQKMIKSYKYSDKILFNSG